MANTLTNMIPDIYAALDVVSRELVGYIPAVQHDSTADRVAVGQNLDVPITPANVAGGTITPAMAFPAAADQTITPVQLTITKQRFYPFSWSGREQRAVNAGAGFLTLKQGQIYQAIRGLTNEIESDLAVAAYKGASRAYGTAGTTPFASTLMDPANVRKILDDNGAPSMDRTNVINTTAGAALRTLATVNKVNEWGSDRGVRAGELLDLHGFGIRESAQVPTVTKGTGASYTSDTAGYAIGATVITLITGTGTVLAGDVVTFAGDTNKYVVSVGVAAPGAITLAAPGLKIALAASAIAMTIGNNFAANTAFSRNAILLATRLPDMPEEGDLASDRLEITDDRSGLVFEFTVYPGFRMVTYHVSANWGVKVLKPEHVAIMLG